MKYDQNLLPARIAIILKGEREMTLLMGMTIKPTSFYNQKPT